MIEFKWAGIQKGDTVRVVATTEQLEDICAEDFEGCVGEVAYIKGDKVTVKFDQEEVQLNTYMLEGIKKQHICMKCGNNSSTHKIYMKQREYGSIFDGDSYTFELCDDCYDEKHREIIEEDPTFVLGSYHYKYEKELEEFINTLNDEVKDIFFGCEEWDWGME